MKNFKLIFFENKIKINEILKCPICGKSTNLIYDGNSVFALACKNCNILLEFDKNSIAKTKQDILKHDINYDATEKLPPKNIIFSIQLKYEYDTIDES